jgi:hypothetical protein
MKEYQERVVEEKKQLDIKIKALEAFLGAEESPQIVSAGEFERLTRQLGVMSQYSGILHERISHFND